jgi:hypothetical protein
MKRILSTLLFGTALALSGNAQTIFSTTLNTQEEFDRWTVIDANGDDNTWMFSPDATDGQRTYYGYHSSNSGDDWLISPAITPTETGTYIVRYKFEAGATYAEALKMYHGNAPTIEALSQNLDKEHIDHRGPGSDYFLINAIAGEPFYVAFYACSDPDKYRLMAEGLEVALCANPVDLAITEITAPTEGENLSNAETVKVKVKNTGNVNVDAGSYTISVSVDGTEKLSQTFNQPIAMGETVELTFGNTVDMTPSHSVHQITATVQHPDDISDANNSITVGVRNIGPATEPYFMGFEADEDTSYLTFANLNNDSGDWNIETNGFFVSPSRTGIRSLCYNYSKENQADDWAFLDGIEMGAGYHVLKFWVSTLDDSHKEDLEVYWGNQADPNAMNNELLSLSNFNSAPYIQKICIFQLDEPQTVYVGFHALSAPDQNWIAIDDIEIYATSADNVEITADNLTNPTEYLPLKASHDITFDVMNTGIADVPATITVHIDSEKVYEKEETLVAQEKRTFSLPGLLDNVAPGTHELVVNVFNPNETNVEDNTLTYTFRLLGTPDKEWDFEDGVVPTEFTIRAEDTYTLSDSAIDEFGATGVGIMTIDEHQYYGTKMLGVSTWFTEAGYADRWVVLPQLKVNDEDACIVLNAGSANQFVNEKYRVKVSTTTDYWTEYESVLSIDNENYVRHNRGASLANYVGKEIFLAINVTTYDGDCISFDNLALFGCSPKDDAVKAISDGKFNLRMDGDNLLTDEDAQVEIFNVNGNCVLKASGNTFNVAELPQGVYIVKASNADGSATAKFIR